MDSLFTPEIIAVLSRLTVAMLLGMVIGTERLLAHKTAGMRTYAFVSMGAALFIIISEMVTAQYLGLSEFDPLRMASQVVVGVGFLGAGIIFFKDKELVGITSASGLWVSAGIGMAVGFGLYAIGIIATLLSLFIFIVLWFIEERLRKVQENHHNGTNTGSSE